jgi:hypothetical protein
MVVIKKMAEIAVAQGGENDFFFESAEPSRWWVGLLEARAVSVMSDKSSQGSKSGK